MPISAQTCIVVTCDNEDPAIAGHGWAELIQHYDTVETAISALTAGDSGWHVSSDSVLCPACHNRLICATYGHLHGPWRPSGLEGRQAGHPPYTRACTRCSHTEHAEAVPAAGRQETR